MLDKPLCRIFPPRRYRHPMHLKRIWIKWLRRNAPEYTKKQIDRFWNIYVYKRLAYIVDLIEAVEGPSNDVEWMRLYLDTCFFGRKHISHALYTPKEVLLLQNQILGRIK